MGESPPQDEAPDTKVYVGIIWIGEAPGKRLRVVARNAEEASAAVTAEYGEGHPFTIHNEEDSQRPR